MDSNCRIKRRLFTYSEEDPIGKQTYFSTTEDRIVFHSCGSDVFTVFSKNNADTMFNIAVDFGPNKIPGIVVVIYTQLMRMVIIIFMALL